MSGYYQQQQQHPFPPHSQSGVQYIIEPYHNHNSAYHAAYGDLQRPDVAAAAGFSSQAPGISAVSVSSSSSSGQYRKRDRELYEMQGAPAAGSTWPPSSSFSSPALALSPSPYSSYPSPSPYPPSYGRPHSPPPPPSPVSSSLSSSLSSHKRSRTGDALPSPVLHLRNVPPAATEADLWSLGASFGRVVRVLIIAASQQAFMQFSSVEESRRMLDHHSAVPASIRGIAVQLDPRYSVRQEIKDPAASASPLTAAPSSAPPLFPPPAAAPSQQSRQLLPNSILLFTIRECRVAVTLPHFHSILAPYSAILKIALFLAREQQSGLQHHKALVQLVSVEAAMRAVAGLQGRSMFEGSNVLEVEYSGLRELRISRQTDRAADYTVRGRGEQGSGGGTGGAAAAGQRDARPLLAFDGAALDPLPPLRAAPAPIIRLALPPASAASLPPNGRPPSSAEAAPPLRPAASPASCVVLAANLEPARVAVEHVFSLFSLYGNPLRVRLMKSKAAALVQMQSLQQAGGAIQHLHGLPLHGRCLAVTRSHHSAITPPSPSSPDAQLCRDYAAPHTLHRYKQSLPCALPPPSATLYVVGLPASCSSEQLAVAFSAFQQGGAPVRAEVFEGSHGRWQGRVWMAALEAAVSALLAMDDAAFMGRKIRVAFSDGVRGKKAVTAAAAATGAGAEAAKVTWAKEAEAEQEQKEEREESKEEKSKDEEEEETQALAAQEAQEEQQQL